MTITCGIPIPGCKKPNGKKSTTPIARRFQNQKPMKINKKEFNFSQDEQRPVSPKLTTPRIKKLRKVSKDMTNSKP